jgi:hypothetical protein
MIQNARVVIRRHLLTILAAASIAIATTPAVGQTKTLPPAPDCGVFYMGAGGYIFAGPLAYRASQFQQKYPKARVSLHHYWGSGSGAGCARPVFVGHSVGAIRAVDQANAERKGRVVSIDPPSWRYGSELAGGTGHVSRQPTRHLFQCTAQFGCGRVTGPNVVKTNLTKFGYGHVPLPNAPEVGRAIMN